MDGINEIYETYSLPEIKQKGLTEIEYNHRCKYLKLYIRLIEKCKNMTENELSDYSEVHHILPRCLGGNNISSNLIRVPVRYHIMIHIVLVEIYPEEGGLIDAMGFMIAGDENSTSSNIATIKRGESITRHFSTRTIAKARERYVAYRGSDEYKAKISGENNHNYGKPLSEELKKTISNTVKDIWRNTDTYKNVLVELKKTRGESPCAKKIVGPDGTIYDCLLDACDASGIPNSTLRGWMKGVNKSKDNHGWHYLDPKNSIPKKRINHKLV